MQLNLPLPEIAHVATGAPPSPRNRVYCNRSLRLDAIDWVGFDMDYTLAIYDQPEMDRLSIEATLRKMVERGYPEALLQVPLRADFPIRGLLVDRKLGNVLKMDRYKYVKRAYHGMREMTKEERRREYHSRRLRPASERYHWVDTLYGLSEVTVYCGVIEHLEAEGTSVDFEQLFVDVRECIDLAHRDGSIKDIIGSDPARYVDRDPMLPATLHAMRSAGKKIFLLTNSFPVYSDRVMRYLLDGALPAYRSWRSYFDVIVCGAGKPGFFAQERPFLRPTKDPNEFEEVTGELERGKLYVGGSIGAFGELLGTTPDRVMYVGDHIYGDVLRANKDSAWRTVMVVQEMDAELQAQSEVLHSLARLDRLEEQRSRLLDEVGEFQQALKRLQRRKEKEGKLRPADEADRQRHRRAVDRLKARVRVTEQEYDQLERGVSQRFHPFWGSIFKAGPEVSLFGHQVETYSGLYTSRVSNFLRYSPLHYFQSPRDRMPHEL